MVAEEVDDPVTAFALPEDSEEVPAFPEEVPTELPEDGELPSETDEEAAPEADD